MKLKELVNHQKKKPLKMIIIESQFKILVDRVIDENLIYKQTPKNTQNGKFRK